MNAEAKQRYSQQKQNAAKRGIEFDFTFEEWWEVWAPHFDKRGPASENLQMCRDRDEGAYRPGNVRIDTGRSNQAERVATMARRAVVEELPAATSVRDATKWVHRRDTWAWYYFKRREYEEEHPGELED